MIFQRLVHFPRRINHFLTPRFNSTLSSSPSNAGMFGRVLAVVAAAGAGGFFYDFLSQKNLQKLSDAIDEDLKWDEEWDRYVRVPSERVDEIKSWFISPNMDIVKQREKFDTDNDIGTREIVMIRHGQYVTEEDAFGNLTDLGVRQAKLTGERLAEILKDRNVRIIYFSNMPRAKQTAAEIAKFFPNVALVETPLLAEAIPAEPDPPSSNCPEYDPEEGKRMESAYRTFFARPIGDKNESVDILVGHGNCFRLFVCRALQIDPRYWLRMGIYNCGISRIELFKSGRVSVRGVGDVGHIPGKFVTYS